jgi:ATP-dependent DNA helicase RecG
MHDLLFHLPLRYENCVENASIGQLVLGQQVLISGQVLFVDILRRKKRAMICRISDSTGFIDLRFFHFNTQQFNALTPGTLISCRGMVRQGYVGLEMIHPHYKIITQVALQSQQSTLYPIYPLTSGLNQSTLQNLINQVLVLCQQQPELLIDYLPKSILQDYHYPTLLTALQNLHHPDHHASIALIENRQSPAFKRLAFEEFLAHSLSMLNKKSQQQHWQALTFKPNNALKQQFINGLGFELTVAQQRVVGEIETDCQRSQPMLRLLQGDVGSGKTIVAALATLLALTNGYQIAIMAPTELLAEQHYHYFNHWFSPLAYSVVLLTGQLNTSRRKQILAEINATQAQVIIGTHALFQASVVIPKLALIIIDEQHRFGVHQRLALRAKGQAGNKRPHQLVMTATPIPRTLAMLQYADLAISIIDELPKGRKAVNTRVISAQRRLEIIERLHHWIAQGYQGYWVCPLIEQSEKFNYEAAEKTVAQLRSNLPEAGIGLIHGRMKSVEKSQLMQAFKAHELDLLVATTVIEVGVDVANAQLMIIENSERLGLSQLHQLRGRVGRGNQDSYCILLYQSPLTDIAQQRLTIIRATHDGFKIAEEDLRLRGAGELMGTRQTGAQQFKVAHPDKDCELLKSVESVAKTLLQQNPTIVEPLIKRWLGDSIHYAEV